MFSFNDIRQKFASTLNLRPAGADMSAVRRFCVELLADIPADQRQAMLERLETLRRASDLWHLRTALFNVIARHHGESIAQERLRDLDRELLPYATPSRRA